jgi:ribosome-associated heat shock protein Hsp15
MNRERIPEMRPARYHRIGERRGEVCVSRESNREPSTRVDVWLDVACLFRTRSEAQKAVGNGKIEVNGQPAKAHRLLHIGDTVIIGRPFGRKQTIVVKGIAEKHVPRAEARLLYEDRTPAPTPEEIELRRMERMYRAAVTPPTTPDKRDRRALRRLKEGE